MMLPKSLLASAAILSVMAGYAPSAFAITANTEAFVKKAAISNQFEIESSKLALQKSQDQEVTAFAKKMIDDHTQVGNRMKAILQSHDVNMAVPAQLDDKHQAMLEDLSDETAEDFDEEYISMQQNAHEEAVSLFQDYAENGDQPKLKSFAAETLPSLKAHREHVERLDEQVD